MARELRTKRRSIEDPLVGPGFRVLETDVIDGQTDVE